ncbi:MAG: type II toxin-antitoxin system VapC family toxin [Planctomycetota bacterium]
MTKLLLVDTDVLIDYFREQPQAVGYIEGLTIPFLISAVTIAELYSGVREGEERKALDVFITTFGAVAVDEEIAAKGGLHRRDYRKSHNIALPDALIAATAEVTGATLVTLNNKHFPMLKNVIVPYVKS